MPSVNRKYCLLIALLTVVPACFADDESPPNSSDVSVHDGSENVDDDLGQAAQASTAPSPQRVFAMGHSIYVVTRDAELLWYGDAAQNGTWGWAPASGTNVIGTGWNSNVRLVFAGGGGIIYTVDGSGNLHWYKDTGQNGTWSWAANSGKVIGTGWNNVIKAFADQSGTIYAVDTSGVLRWYKDVARDGTPGWGAGSGGIIGSGWQTSLWQMADVNGIIYMVDSAGILRWYRDLHQNGTPGWAAGSGNQIGSGWQTMLHAFGAGNGVLYAIDASGQLRYYRDVYMNGSPGWGAGSGNVIGTGWAAISYQPPLASFGHGSLKMNGKSALGSRPVVAILAQYSDQPRFTRPNSYFDNMYFRANPTPPFATPSNPASLSEFIKENSNGRFALTRADSGIVGPVPMGTLAAAGGGGNPQARLKVILTAASAAGFNFASYDTNGDGQVTSDELMVITVENIPNGMPANRPNATPLSLNGKNIAFSHVAMTAEATSFDSLAHEFTHSLGTADLYYGGCLSLAVTIMSCTDFYGSLQNPRHLDPWHRMLLGWIDPAIQRITTSGSTVVTSSSLNRTGAALFWSRARGTTEYFLVEKRSQAQIYDAGVGDTGVAIWHVNASNNGVVALGAPSLSFGGSLLWKVGTSTPTLLWKDNTSTATRFSFASVPLTSPTPLGVEVTWSPGLTIPPVPPGGSVPRVSL